ncbi:MAG: protoporphyrinogen oxidase, partial [Jatrophihabitantaceae bacterium]|nr:protoporphyrinogen oxidase [Jatrophihabitantaceae bacterium]
MEPSESVLIVGAGLAGVACAQALAARDVPVAVVDRGKRIGGRMAVRTNDDRPVDIGASYFTVSDPRFQAVVDGWAARGLAREWTDTFSAVSADAPALTSSSGPMRWGSAGGLRSLVEDLARGLDISQRAVGQIAPSVDGGLLADGTAYRAIVLAMPDPQASRMLHPSLASDADRLDQTYDPVLALTASWPVRNWAPVDGVFINGDADLSFIADDGRRRGDGAPVLVAHSTPAFAR